MSGEDNPRSSKSRRNLFRKQKPIDPSQVQNETCLLEGGVAPPKSIHRRPYGTCSRLTRSSTKQWQEMFGQDKSTRRLDNDMMKPPDPPPLQPQLRGGTSGVITRTRYRNLVRDVPQLQPATKTIKLSNSCGSLLFDSFGNTSDYGTASDDSKNCSLVMDRLDQDRFRESCHCSSMSTVGSIQSEDEPAADMIEEDIATDTDAADLSNTRWDSDCSELDQPFVTVEMDWDSEAELECLRKVRESAKVVMICEEKVTAIIPTINPSGYRGKYRINLNTENDGNSYRRGLCCGLRVHHVSPVVSMEPHGVQFYETLPALLVIPLEVEPQEESWLSCLYSNTPEEQTPQWQRLPKKDFFYNNGCLIITADHFSLFTVILEEPYPEVMKRIRCRTGGRLRMDEVPGVEVEFPRGCLESDVDAYLRVLFDSEPQLEKSSRALASPIIMLGPHGHQFDTNRPPVSPRPSPVSQVVRIMLPVPDYHTIMARFGGRARLSVWQSSTRDGEPMVWEELTSTHISPPDLSRHNPFGLPVVSFTVHHFSFFKLVWDILSASLYEAKVGMSYFHPYISFSMMCQAFMDQGAGNRFGLEVICYRSDRRLPETANYRHRVGASLKPKLVRPGRILVRLRSQMFVADEEAGEDKEMAKEEPDFRGRDFEKQYACKFKVDTNVDRGTFGKVIVERIVKSNKDPLFEFNLNKTGMEADISPPVSNERWALIAMKELALSLQIMEGNNWKKCAQYIGFTKSEIKSKLQYTPDPFMAMVNLYGNRGGTPEEFTQALYAVSRDLRINMSGLGGVHSKRSSSAGDGSPVSSHESGSKTAKRASWWTRRLFTRDSDSDSSPDNTSPTKESSPRTQESSPHTKDSSHRGTKRSHPDNSDSSRHKSKGRKGSASKRRKFSEAAATDSSDEEANNEMTSATSELHRYSPHKLSDQELWQVTSRIVRKDWRNLGRTLGIDEPHLANLEHSYATTGFRECAYQMLLEWKGRKPRLCTVGELSRALRVEGMLDVAKHLLKVVESQDS
uniref:Death domain-containing protein n=1 Tax=Timema bartmani TaxID=61472 RepID=A0A7R9F9G4_9NEOP|nr:unnamed protein product [Timema bartmani]